MVTSLANTISVNSRDRNSLRNSGTELMETNELVKFAINFIETAASSGLYCIILIHDC